MAQLVLAAAGSALGGAFLPTVFGISGASLGYFAGSLLGSALFKPPGQQGPRLDDRTFIGTEYGQAIPWVAGSPRLAGQVVWITNPLREIASTQKVGKGGGQKATTYTYEGDILILLTENVTEGVARDWLNSELVRAGLTLKDGVCDSITIYTGEDDQLPFPPYEAAVGVGNAPAFRGRTSIGITGFKFGNRKSLGNLEHQIGTPIFGRDDFDFYVPFDSDYDDVSENGLAAEVQQSNPATYQFAIGAGKFGGSLSYVGNPESPSTESYVRYSSSVFSLGAGKPAFTIGFWVKILARPSIGTGTRIIYIRRVAINPDPIDISESLTGITISLSTSDFDIPVDLNEWTYFAISRSLGGNVKIFKNGAQISSVDVALIEAADVLYFCGFVGNDRHPLVELDDFFLIKGVDLYPFDFGVPESSAGQEERPPYLSEVLSGLIERAGYASNEFEIIGLDDVPTYGYSTGDVTSTRAHLETLRPFGQYEANCSDKLYIFPRATEPAGAIPWSDLGASESPGGGGDPFPIRFDNEIERPAQIALRYRNVAADWNVGTETSERIDASQASTQVAEMAVGMTPAQAKAVVDAMLKDLMAGLGKVTLKVGGRKHAKYEPGDIITVTDPTGRLYRLRILVKRDSVFMIEWECVLDDASALVSPAITYEGYVSTETPLRVAPTDFEVMNLRPLRDADATEPGPYVAVTPLRENANDEWPGAVFVRARLEGQYEQEFTTGDACVIGECLTTLGSYAKGSAGVQREGKLRVKVMGELSSATWADFTADRTLNAALVGEREGIRFQIADFIGTDGLFNIYDLSIFLRGQLGEESAIATHGAGERFVLLNGALRRMVNEVTDIDTEQQVKAVTLNTLLSEVTDLDFTDNAKALRPVSPWRLRALPNTSGDLEFTAKRRSRLIARYTETGTFTPLGEATEAYTLRIYDGITLVRTEALTTPAYTYAAADIASDGFTTGDPITFELVQLSETVGEGTAETLTRPAP